MFTLRFVEFLTENTIPQKDAIYIYDFRTFEDKLSTFSCDTLISIGSPGESVVRKCKCVLEVPSSVNPFELLNTVNRIFEYYRSWDESLQNIYRRQGTVKDLLNASTEIFGTQIGIHDRNLVCIIDSDYPEGDELENAVLTRRKSWDYITGFWEDKNFQATFEIKGAFFEDSSSSSGKTLAQNIFVDGVFGYRVIITERHRPLKPQDKYLLEHLVSYIEPLMAVSTTGNEDQTYLKAFLSDVLDNSVQDIDLFRERFRSQRWMDSDYYLCAILVMNTGDIFGTTASAICTHLQRLIPNSIVFVHHKRIVAIVDMGPNPASQELIAKLYTEYMRDMNMKSGISNVCKGYRCISDLYLQADIALKMGARLWSTQWLFRFHEIAPYYVLEQCTRDLQVASICAPEIIGLYQYDLENATEYFRTVKIYLEYNMNLAETSRQLFIHRTTLIYRLSKIQELFPMRFDDPLQRVYYHLSILLVTYTSFQLTEGMD